MRKSFVSIGCFFFMGCSNAQTSVELDGQRFCIPKEHMVPEVPWVKPDGKSVRESKGIAIKNCMTERLADNSLIKSKCLFSTKIDGLVIDEDDGYRDTKPGDIDFGESVVGRVVMASDTMRTISDDRRLLVMENPRIWRSLYVWYRKDGRFSPDDLPRSETDELLVSCNNSRTKVGAAGGQMRPAVECDRKLISNGLAISYSFESASKVPSFDVVSRFDAEVVRGFSKFRCD